MVGQSRREMTVEQFNDWAAAVKNVAEVHEATWEEGGPAVSLVPAPRSVPLEILPDEVTVPAAVPADPSAVAAMADGDSVVPFAPQPSRKAGGWSRERQQLFIETLAETGSIHLSAKTAGLSARSAYALRVRSAAFAAAWDGAQQLAVGRLSALAFDRAIHGRIDQIYRDGELVGEKRVPNDRLLMWLLARLDPKRFGGPADRSGDEDSDPQAEAHRVFDDRLRALVDMAAD